MFKIQQGSQSLTQTHTQAYTSQPQPTWTTITFYTTQYESIKLINVWLKPLQYCKAISLQLIKINKKINKKLKKNRNNNKK